MYRALIAGLTLSLCLAPVAQAVSVQAVTEDTAYSYLEGGRVAGPASAVVEATLQRAGLDYRIDLYPWARAYDKALQEPGTLIYLIARTPERELLFQWVGELMRIDYHFFKLRERTDVTVERFEEARRYRVGVLRDDVRQIYLEANGFDKLVVTAQNVDNFRQLLAGRVDLVPMPEHDVLELCRQLDIDPARIEKAFTPQIATRLYMAFQRHTDEALVLRTRAAFEHLDAEGQVDRLMGR